MFNYIGYLINALFEIIILFLYTNTLFIQRCSRHTRNIFLASICFVLYLASNSAYSWLYTILFTVFTFSYMFLTQYVKWYIALLHTLILLSSKTVISLLVFNIINHFYLCRWGTKITTVTDFVYVVTRQILYFCVIGIITQLLQTKQQKEAQLQLLYQKESDNARYYRSLVEQDESHRRLIHDIRNHLATIDLLNENGEKEKIHTYIKNLQDLGNLNTSVRRCDNQLLNAILCRYAQQCEAVHVAFHTDIRNHTLDFLSDVDMTTLMCNLLDNAVSAANSLPAAFIELSVYQKENAPISVLSIINRCSQAPSVDRKGSYISQKSNQLLHGIGLKNVKRVVENYNGIINMHYDPQSQTFHTILTLQDSKAALK